MFFWFLVLIFFSIVTIIEIGMSARILAVAPTPSYSHQIAYRPLWKELLSRGHKVVLITTNPMCDCASENFTQIDLSETYDIINSEENQLRLHKFKNQPMKFCRYFSQLIRETSIATLEHKDVQNIIHDRKQCFDLVIVEAFYSAMLAFSTRFNCPSIVITSMDANLHWHGLMGNPTHPVAYPDVSLPFRNDLTFMARVKSVLYWLSLKYLKITNYNPRDQKIINKYFENSTNIKKLQSNVDMLFINGNPLLTGNRPLTPNTINYGGGVHIQEPKPLPKDLQNFFDSATQGAIYLSLGSNIKSKYLRDELKTIFMETFRELPYKVLWKFEIGDVPGRPRNVKLTKWAPQQDILRHPNVKLFITQGGLQSLEEGLYSHVPMIGIPFMDDQGGNVAELVKRGIAIKLNHHKLTKDEFKSAIEEIIRNHSQYKQSVKKWADLSLDYPYSGVETAGWWAEYVIRHKGAKHLRNTSSQLPCYQFFLLDVIGFLFIVLALIALGFYLLWVKLISSECDDEVPEAKSHRA